MHRTLALMVLLNIPSDVFTPMDMLGSEGHKAGAQDGRSVKNGRLQTVSKATGVNETL